MPREPAIQNWRVVWGLRLFVYAIPWTLLALAVTFSGWNAVTIPISVLSVAFFVFVAIRVLRS